MLVRFGVDLSLETIRRVRAGKRQLARRRSLESSPRALDLVESIVQRARTKARQIEGDECITAGFDGLHQLVVPLNRHCKFLRRNFQPCNIAMMAHSILAKTHVYSYR